MFRQRTTIIVGAGASCELGLPSGDALKGKILNLLKPTRENGYGFSDTTMIELLEQRGDPRVWDKQAGLARVREAAERIRKGLPLALSIDNFLHSHQGDEEVEQLGKLTIAISILRAEAQSHLFRRASSLVSLENSNAKPDMHINGKEISESWYPAFAQLLMSGVQRDNVSMAFENLRFIIFNYDRCLEQYIWMALQQYFDIDEKEASEVLSNVSFLHPYGSLGPLPWRSNNGAVPLGYANVSDLMNVASRIRTFTESVRSDLGNKVKESVEWADTLVILGFGYLDQNIQLLSPLSDTRSNRVFSTAYGVSGYDQIVMRDAMMALGGVQADSVMIDSGSCRNLFDNYRLHLSLR